MTVIVETTPSFKDLPEHGKKIADRYMLNKEFRSLEELLHTCDDMGWMIGMHFYPASVKISCAGELPITITEVDLLYKYSEINDHSPYSRVVAGLKAKYIEKE